MAQIVCYEVFPTERNLNKMRSCLVNHHGFKEKKNHVGPYFYLEVSSMDSWMIKSLLKWKRYKFRSFDKRYERSSSYRKAFFENNKGPYRCAYCGRRLKSNDIEVDHLIPVAKAKSKISVRTWLHICGIANVNDPRNLVAACEKCNRKKSDKMGGWVLRGALGRHKIFWTIRNIVLIAIFVLVVGLLFSNQSVMKFVQSTIRSIIG
jgi:hypothetical protein